MTPENAIALKAHIQAAAFGGKLPPKTCLAIAAILYEDTPEKLNTLEEIEQTVRQKVIKHVSPEIGVFLSNQSQGQPQAEKEN